MKWIELATYKTDDVYRGHSRINRYHWEVGFKCFRVDNSSARELGLLLNGEPPADTFQIHFLNWKGDVVRVSEFTSREEANAVVKKYIQHGFRKVGKQ